MNEAVFPIENGNNFIATLVYSTFKSFQVLSSPHLSEESIGKLAVWEVLALADGATHPLEMGRSFVSAIIHPGSSTKSP